MTTRPYPTLPTATVASHNTSTSCYVTLGAKVYDVTSFLSDHPGGSDLITEYGGKDVTEIMADEISHTHSESAYEVLDDCFVGYIAGESVVEVVADSDRPEAIVPFPPTREGIGELARRMPNGAANGTANGTANGQAKESAQIFAATGMSCAEDLAKETDTTADYRRHKFLDLNKPLFPQMWYGGFSKDFYLEQVHRPRHYKGGASAPLFGNFLEPLSKTAWWVIPIIWLPVIICGTVFTARGLGNPLATAAYWFTGLGIWTIVEYGLHRCLFHLDDYLPNNRVAITAHFLLHGIHHYLPMDKYRLVMPPTLMVALIIPFWNLAHAVFFYNYYAATGIFFGGLFGYMCYDLTHYFLHHRNLPSYYRELKKYHLQHHFADYENGFGVTSRFWDRIFKTELLPPKVLKVT